MKFGKEFRTHLEKTLPEWRDKFLCYKLLKKLLNHYPAAVSVDLPPDARRLPAVQGWFAAILYEELEKFNDFYVEKEEEFIIRFQALKERIERVKETEFSEEMMKIRKDFVSIHGEMVLLKSYSSLNFAGLIKILKKYDKRTGDLLSFPFTRLAFHQPFFTTQPLTRLVRECEEKLEILFPIEPEVIEPNPPMQDQTAAAIPPADLPNTPLESALSFGEEKTVGIYKSTLAAINAIQGLKKASSTYNPMSMSFLFGSHLDSECTGGVTAQNSPSNSFIGLHDVENENEDIFPD
ncbi:SPX domain-containing protein 4 [Striga hermonthica]|uniref:SPX domain-containing protein 4 n=1 Tax=Striga hermonthica TaxID=68872 RepID=A0A9N7NGH5_STRHE|nr:SPX domain-containing protein 4 [Striga hermonthica]